MKVIDVTNSTPKTTYLRNAIPYINIDFNSNVISPRLFKLLLLIHAVIIGDCGIGKRGITENILCKDLLTVNDTGFENRFVIYVDNMISLFHDVKLHGSAYIRIDTLVGMNSLTFL